jgi:hypothetical protein
MSKHNQDGAINVLLVPLILAVVIIVVTISFAGWAYSSRQDYKNNVALKVATAVQVANQTESSLKDKQFAEAEKSPLKTYNGPQAYGSLVVQYPKTWSGYVDDSGSGDGPIDGYFNPGVVPSIADQSSTFALRIEVLSASYSATLQQFQGQMGITTIPYSLPKVPSVVGVEINGQIQNDLMGSMVILPLRSNTLEIYTEGTTYENDFATYILPNISFSP